MAAARGCRDLLLLAVFLVDVLLCGDLSHKHIIIASEVIRSSSNQFTHSTANLKISLALDDLPLFLVQLDDVCVLRPVVDMLQKSSDLGVLALRLALDLEPRGGFS